MKKIIDRQIESRQRRMARRLDKLNYPEDMSKPMMRGSNIQFELSDRTVGTAYGGIGLIHQFVGELGLADAIDQRLHLFKIHLPYHESDHVLSLAYNALCEGRCLEDLELRRQDEAYLNLLGATRIPDPDDGGDFLPTTFSRNIYRLFTGSLRRLACLWGLSSSASGASSRPPQ